MAREAVDGAAVEVAGSDIVDAAGIGGRRSEVDTEVVAVAVEATGVGDTAPAVGTGMSPILTRAAMGM